MEYREGQTATNPKTGQKIVYQGGFWVAAGGPESALETGEYRSKLASEMAKKDMGRIEGAFDAERSGYALEATADQAARILPNTPTGLFPDARIALGKAVPFLSALPGIPNQEQTANLETTRRLGAMGTLGDVGKLKGPLSEKELAFIQTMQLNPGASREENRRVIETMKWTAKRQTAYGAALQEWTRRLGSPSARNAQGQSFDAWWGGYSARAIPPPGVRPASGAPARPPAKPAPAKPAAGTRLRYNPATGDFE
jgi:hypothetical protein